MDQDLYVNCLFKFYLKTTREQIMYNQRNNLSSDFGLFEKICVEMVLDNL